MKKMIIIGAKLALICGIAATLLGFVNSVTEPKILEMKAGALKEALSAVSMGWEIGDITAVDDPGNKAVTGYYPVTDDSGTIKGYILELLGDGYAGSLKIITGITGTGEIRNVVLMDNEETPGLGKEAENPEYMQKFIGTGAERPVPVRKDQLSQGDADAISGASVTFIGIGKALESGIEYFFNNLNGGAM